MGYSPWGRKGSDTTEQLHFLSFYYVMYTVPPKKKYNGLSCSFEIVHFQGRK